MKFYYHGSIFRQKFQAVLEYAFNESDTPSSPLPCKDKGLRDIGQKMSIRNLIWGVNSVTA